MDNRAIGVFDSGLGGLTAVKEIRKYLSGEGVVYFGDTGRIPYGTRGNDTIIKYAKQDIRFLRSFDVKCVVAACGTVSSVALPHLEQLEVPVVGVIEPAVEAAKKATVNGKIGVVGTPATIRSRAYERGLAGYQVMSKACPLLVSLVEDGRQDHIVTKLMVEEYLSTLVEGGIDTLILGCTHYPIIEHVIREFCGDGIALISPGVETARYVKTLIEPCDTVGSERYFVSDSVEQFSHLAGLFLGGEPPKDVTHVAIEEY